MIKGYGVGVGSGSLHPLRRNIRVDDTRRLPATLEVLFLYDLFQQNSEPCLLEVPIRC